MSSIFLHPVTNLHPSNFPDWPLSFILLVFLASFFQNNWTSLSFQLHWLAFTSPHQTLLTLWLASIFLHSVSNIHPSLTGLHPSSTQNCPPSCSYKCPLTFQLLWLASILLVPLAGHHHPSTIKHLPSFQPHWLAIDTDIDSTLQTRFLSAPWLAAIFQHLLTKLLASNSSEWPLSFQFTHTNLHSFSFSG